MQEYFVIDWGRRSSANNKMLEDKYPIISRLVWANHRAQIARKGLTTEIRSNTSIYTTFWSTFVHFCVSSKVTRARQSWAII